MDILQRFFPATYWNMAKHVWKTPKPENRSG
jgi:hypothetical protein